MGTRIEWEAAQIHARRDDRGEADPADGIHLEPGPVQRLLPGRVDELDGRPPHVLAQLRQGPIVLVHLLGGPEGGGVEGEAWVAPTRLEITLDLERLLNLVEVADLDQV